MSALTIESISSLTVFLIGWAKGINTLIYCHNRVQSLLEEYSSAANGKIELRIIDPEPFSEAEDQASQFGLTAAKLVLQVMQSIWDSLLVIR